MIEIILPCLDYKDLFNVSATIISIITLILYDLWYITEILNRELDFTVFIVLTGNFGIAWYVCNYYNLITVTIGCV